MSLFSLSFFSPWGSDVVVIVVAASAPSCMHHSYDPIGPTSSFSFSPSLLLDTDIQPPVFVCARKSMLYTHPITSLFGFYMDLHLIAAASRLFPGFVAVC